MLREPAFPETDFEQVKQQRIAALETGRAEPTTLAAQELQRHLSPFARATPRYVGTLDEQIAELKKVTLEDVKKFHEQFYGADRRRIDRGRAISTRPRCKRSPRSCWEAGRAAAPTSACDAL